MSEEIKAGDLVVVVRGCLCCGLSRSIGKVATVGVGPFYETVQCLNCGAIRDLDETFAWIDTGTHSGFIEKDRLKRIDPPALPESIDESQEVTA